MSFSQWRRIYPVEAVVLIILLGGGLVILVLIPADLVERLGLALASFAAGGATGVQLHSTLKDREWKYYRRPTIAFFLGYSLTWLMIGDDGTNPHRSKGYRERTKQLLLQLNLGDPTLLELVDVLGPARNGGAAALAPHLEILERIGLLFTGREQTYFGFWQAFAYYAMIPKHPRAETAVRDYRKRHDILDGMEGMFSADYLPTKGQLSLADYLLNRLLLLNGISEWSEDELDHNTYDAYLMVWTFFEQLSREKNPFIDFEGLRGVMMAESERSRPPRESAWLPESLKLEPRLDEIFRTAQTRLTVLWERLLAEE